MSKTSFDYQVKKNLSTGNFVENYRTSFNVKMRELLDYFGEIFHIDHKIIEIESNNYYVIQIYYNNKINIDVDPFKKILDNINFQEIFCFKFLDWDINHMLSEHFPDVNLHLSEIIIPSKYVFILDKTIMKPISNIEKDYVNGRKMIWVEV